VTSASSYGLQIIRPGFRLNFQVASFFKTRYEGGNEAKKAGAMGVNSIEQPDNTPPVPKA